MTHERWRGRDLRGHSISMNLREPMSCVCSNLVGRKPAGRWWSKGESGNVHSRSRPRSPYRCHEDCPTHSTTHVGGRSIDGSTQPWKQDHETR